MGKEYERAYCLSEWVEVHAVEFEEVIAGEWSSRCHLDSGSLQCIAVQVEKICQVAPHTVPPHTVPMQISMIW
jgi:hypothetical protein